MGQRPRQRRRPLLVPGVAVLRSDGPVPPDAGPGFSMRPIDLDGVALPLTDQLVVIAPDGMVVALSPGGRRLWEAIRAGCTVDELVAASVQDGSLREDVARKRIGRALASWRALGLISSGARHAEAASVRGAGRGPARGASPGAGRGLPARGPPGAGAL